MKESHYYFTVYIWGLWLAFHFFFKHYCYSSLETNCEVWEGSHELFSIYEGIRASDIERNKISVRNKSLEERVCAEHANTSSKIYKTGNFLLDSFMLDSFY